MFASLHNYLNQASSPRHAFFQKAAPVRQHEKKRTKALLTLVLAVWDDVRTFMLTAATKQV